jgi:enamine deaminase RidA (YjgF/YER057c/UK114 family)
VSRQRIGSGSAWEQKYGYSRAVVDGDWVFVSGCTGTDYATGEIVDGAATQVAQAFKNTDAALREAGSEREDIVQARYYIADRADVDLVLSAIGVALAAVRPAATAVTRR